ncbi:MAG: hypothetical protein AAF770_03280 [Bacteroidota bacterium]
MSLKIFLTQLINQTLNTFFGSFARYFTVAVSSCFCLLALVSQLVA